jgi:hypothetical protein
VISFPAGTRDLSLFHVIQIGSGTYPTYIPMGTGGRGGVQPVGVKQKKRDSGHSPPSVLGVLSMRGAIPQFLYTSSWHGA